MKKFISKIVLVLLPVFIILVSVNYFGDAANLFSKNFEMQVAEGLLSGHHVTNVYDYNERLLQKYVVSGSKSCPDMLVLGSSRSMEINSPLFPGRSFYNNSVSGATIEDMLAIYKMYEMKNCHPKSLILCLDPWTLNKNNNQTRWESLAREYNVFRREMNLDTVPHTGEVNIYSQLISPSYFAASLASLRKSKKPRLTKEAVNKDMTRLSDGSVCYGADHRNLTSAQTEASARDYAKVNNIYSVEKFNELSPDVKRMLEYFIHKLKLDGVSVTFFLSPYHPIVYHVFETNPQYINISQSEIYYKALAKSYNIPVIGSFDPKECGMDGSFFYDGMHCTTRGIEKLFAK